MNHPVTVVEILAVLLVLSAAVTDIRTRKIPNWLTASGVTVGLIANGAAGGMAGLRLSLGGLALGFGAYLVLYLLRAIGAGDVKLMAAVGAIVGSANWMSVFVASAWAWGLLAVALVIWKSRVHETLRNVSFLTHELAHCRLPYNAHPQLDVKGPGALKMPHGVAVAAGTVACVWLALI